MSITAQIISILSNSYLFVYKWGYVGIFFVTLLESASILFFPLPSFPLIFTLGSMLNPFLVALSASLGATLGMTTTYVLGLGGKELMEKKYSRQLEKTRNAFEKYGSFWWLILIILVPFLPDNIAGIFCGVIKYDIKKYYSAVFIGKLMAALIFAYAGHYSIEWLLDFFKVSLPVL